MDAHTKHYMLIAKPLKFVGANNTGPKVHESNLSFTNLFLLTNGHMFLEL